MTANANWFEFAHTPRALAAALVVSLVVATASGGDRAGQKPSPPAADSITLATSRYAGAAPVFVAVAQHLFEDEGLKVTIQTYSSGKSSLDAVIAGNADVATVAELPVALGVAKGYPVTILATMSAQADHGVVARLDRGISGPASLRGKRIAITEGSSGDFFLDALLIRQGISRADVQVIDRKPDQLMAALVNGDADAISTWEPYVSETRRRLGANGALFSGERIYESTFNIAAMRDFASRRSDTVTKLLRAMARAEKSMVDDPAAAEAIVARALDKTPQETHQLLARSHFALSLDQNLIVVMEDESRWAVKNRIVDAKGRPNFLNAVYTQGLDAIDPRSVTVIR